jgi:tripartite-type tricarboxylate transporter receptor subunit TctC
MSRNHPTRRTALAALTAAVATSVLPAFAQGAAGFPARPIKIVVPYAAGGFTDIVARLVAQKMSESLKQPVIVDNKPGASTIIGAEMVARSAPDGYTLLMGVTTTLSTNPFLFKKLPYQPSDFKPVALTGLTPFVLMAHPSVGISTVRELIQHAKAKPKTLTAATLGNGSSTQLVLAMLQAATGTSIVDVPYKGSAPAMTDLLAGHVDMYFDALPTSLASMRSGQLKAIAVTSEARSKAAPSVPTFRESDVKDMVAYSWYGLLAPAGTPDAIVELLGKAANEAMETPAIQQKLEAEGALAPVISPRQFGELIQEHTKTWGRVIGPLNIRLD